MSRQSDLAWKRTQLQRQQQRRADAKQQIKQLRNEIAELEAKPILPVPGRQIIYFQKQYESNGTFYQYAAIRANDLWYVTGRLAPNGVTWEQLSDFIYEDNQVPYPGYHNMQSSGTFRHTPVS